MPTSRRARPSTRRARTRSRTWAAPSWRASTAPTATSWGSPWRGRARGSRGRACPSGGRARLERLLEGLGVKHVLGARDPERGGEGRVGPDDRDRLLDVLDGHAPVGDGARARRLEPRLELVLGAGHAPVELRGERRGARRADALLRGEERFREGGKHGIPRAPVGADEESCVDRLLAEGRGDRRGGAEVGEELRPALADEPAREGLGDERRMELARVDRADQAARAHAQEGDGGETHAGAGQEAAEPGGLGGGPPR